MRTFRQRVWVSVLVIACGLTAGGIAGYFLERALILKQSQARLEQYATRIVEATERSTAESRSVLAAMNGSQYGACSDAEMSYFGNLIYESQYLKAGGRMHDGRIVCSTSQGRVARSSDRVKPGILQRDGTRLYLNLAPFRVGKEVAPAVQQGDAFVVYSPYRWKSLIDSSMQLTMTDLDIKSSGAAPAARLVTNGQFRDNDVLYGTHCTSNGGAICVAAHISVARALETSRLELGGFIALGQLTGALLGLVCAIFYQRQHDLANQLLRAIRRDDLRIVYQPIVDLETGDIVEGEALARWTTENNQAISPDDFIRVAEQRGFVGQITKLVVHRVLRDFGKTMRERPGFRMNVNIAAADLADPQFLPMLEKALSDANVPASALGIEITESYTARQQVAKETILRLRERGHYVHIDDFGTGYSSLAYLHDLSVDAIKIDKAFTRAIGTDAVTVTILPQILTMADTLGLRVVVEGIETEEQARYFTRANQSIYAQGWLFGRPVSPDAFHRLLESKKAESEFSAMETVGAAVATAPAC